MRHVLISAILFVASPALADVIEMRASVAEVTIYPQNASVTRIASGDLPAGRHSIVIPGLPQDTDPDMLRVTAEGVVLGSFSLQTDRALPDDAPDSPEIAAARDEVFRLERELRDRDAAVAAIRVETGVAEDMTSYLQWLATSDGAASGDFAALTDFVEDRLRSTRQAAIAAETRALAQEQGRDQLVRALDAARARLAALENPETDRAALILLVESDGAPARIEVSSTVHGAAWRPVYDIHLNEGERQLVLDRGLMVSQSTGEDWQGVRLTLSTARPTGQSAPSVLQSRVLRTVDPKLRARIGSAPMAEMAVSGAMADTSRIAPLPTQPVLAYQGNTVVYEYDAPVDLRSGADEMRLSLGETALPVEALVAEAVPSRDESAYLVADSRNALEEVILPGRVILHADGAMVGMTDLPLIPAGEEIKLGFGPIDGIVLERRTPERVEGDRGLIRRDTELGETAILSAKNLTGRDYDLRMIDQVPVSEQEELRIDWQASIEPSETDPDGERGLLVWEMPLAAGETQEITLSSIIRWPEGKEIFP